MKYLLCLLFISYTLNASEYIKYDNIVIDETNKLMWQDNIEVIEYLENFTTAPVYCENIVLNGYIDWRVPSINEMIKIIDVNETKAINKKFHYVKPALYGTVSTFTANETRMWKVDFSTGQVKIDEKNKESYVRCVRDVL